MALPLALITIGGGAAALAVHSGETADQTAAQTQVGSMEQAVQSRPLLGSKLATVGVTIGQLQSNLSPAPGVTAPVVKKLTISRSYATELRSRLFGVSSGNASNPVDPQIQAKLDEIDKYGKAAYNQLSAEAKKEGAKALSESLGIDPPLKGDETWETIASVAGSAAGAAVGAYIGGPIGAKLGAIVGAYLGVKLEELISKDLDKIGDWFKSKWSDIENWVGDEASDAANAVGNWLGSIF